LSEGSIGKVGNISSDSSHYSRSGECGVVEGKGWFFNESVKDDSPSVLYDVVDREISE
jgi:hypothetical protein